MTRYLAALTLSLFLGLTAFTGVVRAADKIPDYITAAVADPGRPAADRESDPNRKPAEVLAVIGVKPGQTVIDLIPGSGYFTRILSKAVGPKGHVYGVWPAGASEKAISASKEIAADPAYSNVTIVEQPLLPARAEDGQQIVDWTWKAPPVDIVFNSRNYHDFHNMKSIDIAMLNKGMLAALKPSGVYVVIDHAANPWTGFGDTNSMHRIDAEAVKPEVEGAGFVLAKESDVLKRSDDPHTAKIFDPAIRGKTDQFMLIFKKAKK